MNKTEKAAFAALREENAQLKALRLAAPPEQRRDVFVPTHSYVDGFDYDFDLFLVCSDPQRAIYPARTVASCTRRWGVAAPAEQARKLYSSNDKALRGLRCELFRFYGKKIASIDAALPDDTPVLEIKTTVAVPASLLVERKRRYVAPPQSAAAKLTLRHITFARNVLSLNIPRHRNPKTADDLMAQNYVRVTHKGLYELTARGKQWLNTQMEEPSKPKRASPFSKSREVRNDC